MSRRPCLALQRQWRDDALETPERAAERVRAREIGKQAHAETVAKFPGFTPPHEAIAFQEQRIRELTAEAAS